MKKLTCYMCDKPETSKEHVPPKCLFPKGMRGGLITVPSCHIHNSYKSDDDAYLKDILCSCLTKGDNNKFQNDRQDSIDRAYRRDAKLGKNLVENTIIENGKPIRSVDVKKLEDIFRHIVAGLLFHHYKHKIQHLDQCKFNFSFVNPSKENTPIHEEISSMFEKYEEHGEHKEIFKYKVIPSEWLDADYYAIQMIFFDELEITGHYKV